MAEDWEEIRSLGRGSFGDVVLARRPGVGLCAVKKIRGADMASGEESEHLAEVRALQSLEHPCILRFYGSVKGKDRSLNLIMEYADSGDLQQLLRRRSETNRSFDVMTCLAIFAQLAAAVEYMHSNKVLHRDLKPSNVLLTAGGTLKLSTSGLPRWPRALRSVTR